MANRTSRPVNLRRSPWTLPHWLAVTFAALVIVGVSSCSRCSGSGPSYDADPLLASIRPGQRAALAGQVGVGALDELPLYDIDIALDLEMLGFQGRERVIMTNRTGQPLSDVVFRLYPNARQLNVGASRNLVVDQVQVDGAEAIAVEQDATTLRISLPRELAPGESTEIQMALRGSLPRHRGSGAGVPGLGQLLDLLGSGEAQGTDYGIYGASDTVINMGLWYPRLADWNDQGWDAADPAALGDISTVDLGNYRVTITTAPSIKVVTTGSEVGQEPSDGGLRRTYVAAAVRSFAWQASQVYTSQTTTVGDVVVRSTYDLAHPRHGEQAMQIAAAALTFYEQRFGPYPYGELDVVEAPLRGGAGGVEWPGLVTIASMLYQDPEAVTSGLTGPLQAGDPSDEYWNETFEFVVAHEVAHQYWNAVVGSDSRTHPFIDESMAQFSAAAYFGDRYGPQREQQVLERQVRLNYHLHRLLGGADGAVDRPVDQFGNALEYAGIVYGKGPYYLVALRRDLGEGAFYHGLATYYERFRFRRASQSDLPAVLAEVSSNQPLVQSLTQRWLHEAHGDEDLGRATLSAVIEPIFGSSAAELMRLLESLFGSGTGSGLDPGRIIEDAIRGLGGDGLQGLLNGLLGGGSGNQQPAPQPQRPAPQPQRPAPQPQRPAPQQRQQPAPQQRQPAPQQQQPAPISI